MNQKILKVCLHRPFFNSLFSVFNIKDPNRLNTLRKNIYKIYLITDVQFSMFNYSKFSLPILWTMIVCIINPHFKHTLPIHKDNENRGNKEKNWCRFI